ncbi:unnamed protein product, partial [Amoebophrya sp. A25]
LNEGEGTTTTTSNSTKIRICTEAMGRPGTIRHDVNNGDLVPAALVEEFVRCFLTPAIQFEDPISLQVMEDPSVASDGFVYERESLERWLQRSDRSPNTREQLWQMTGNGLPCVPVRLLN